MRVSGDLVGLFTKALRLEKPPKAQFLLQFHIPVKDIHLSTMDASMSCSHCKRTLPLSSFLANASADLGSRVFATCLHCRERSRSRRRASQPLAPPRPPPQPLLSCPTSVATHQESRTPPCSLYSCRHPCATSVYASSASPASGRRLPPRRTMGVHPGFSQRAG